MTVTPNKSYPIMIMKKVKSNLYYLPKIITNLRNANDNSPCHISIKSQMCITNKSYPMRDNHHLLTPYRQNAVCFPHHFLI